MKTALTELLEHLQKDYDGLERQKTEVSKIFKIAVATVMKNIEDLYLSKEKEQMMEVVEFCNAHSDDGHFDKEGAIANIKSTFNL